MQATLFRAQSYDQESLVLAHRSHGHAIPCREERLMAAAAPLAKGSSAVCISMNNQADAAALDVLAKKTGGDRLIQRQPRLIELR